MNTDQLYNLIQKLIVLASGGLIAKGIGDSSIWEGVGGTVAGIVVWYISHKWNATPPPPALGNNGPGGTPPMSLGGAIHLLLIAGLCLGMVGGLTSCGTTAQQAAYVAAGSVQVSAETALAAWNEYVGLKHPPVADELKVKAAYEKYQAAMIVVIDAGALFASTSTTNTAGVTGASAALELAKINVGQDLADLVALVQSYGVKLTK